MKEETRDDEKRRKYKKQYYRKNKDRYRFYGRRSRKSNPQAFRARVRNYRARKRDADGEHTAEQCRALLNHYGGKCLKCGSEGRISMDHVIPLSVGGSNGPENLQPLCKSCNSEKGTKIADYRPDGGKFAQELTREQL